VDGWASRPHYFISLSANEVEGEGCDDVELSIETFLRKCRLWHKTPPCLDHLQRPILSDLRPRFAVSMKKMPATPMSRSRMAFRIRANCFTRSG